MVQQGDTAEIIVAGEIMREGYPVSTPLTDNEAYDLIVDIHGDLVKVQVKRMHERDRENSIHASLTKRGGSMSQGRSYYQPHEVDAFAFVYSGQCFWSWFDETPQSSITLSLKDKENIDPRHVHKTRLAEDYLLHRKI